MIFIYLLNLSQVTRNLRNQQPNTIYRIDHLLRFILACKFFKLRVLTFSREINYEK